MVFEVSTSKGDSTSRPTKTFSGNLETNSFLREFTELRRLSLPLPLRLLSLVDFFSSGVFVFSIVGSSPPDPMITLVALLSMQIKIDIFLSFYTLISDFILFYLFFVSEIIDESLQISLLFLCVVFFYLLWNLPRRQHPSSAGKVNNIQVLQFSLLFK